jgi:hypothetical protein
VNNTIVNAASGVITLGDDSVGIFAAGNSTVTNAGQITIGDAAGLAAVAIIAINDDNTVSNLAGATITVGLNAVGILMQGNRAIVNNAGTINATAFGAGIDVFGDDALITSNGLINVGDNAAGISAQGDRALITHFGTINGGIGSAGVAYNGSSGTINNSGRILLGDDAVGIVVLGDSNTITNSGTITVGAGFAAGIDVTSFGGSIITEQAYQSGDNDFRAQLTAIKAKHPDAIIVPGYYTEAGLIARQARELGLKQPLVGGDGWESEKLLEIGGEALNGCYFSDHYSTDDPNPAVQKFVNDYKTRYGQVPDALAALAYDAARVLADAMTRAGSTDGVKLRDEIGRTKDFPGVTGNITINSKGYKLGLVVLPPQGNTGAATHETGHGFGWDHSRALSTPMTDYQDCYDMMSFDVCRNYTATLYTFQGDFGADLRPNTALVSGRKYGASLRAASQSRSTSLSPFDTTLNWTPMLWCQGLKSAVV